MKNVRKFSVFISSTYEDLKSERQALVGVALENNFIPVGMEQFHAAPTSQWNVITKMIDECDVYLLVIGARYGSIDKETGISYTEKEYNYAKAKGLPVLVLIKESSAITESEKDAGEDKYEKMKKLDEFRKRVKNEENTVDFFTDLNSLRYVASPTFRNVVNYVDDNAGWVRYRDIVDVINEEANGRNKANAEFGEYQQKMLEDMREMLKEELALAKKRVEELEETLKILLLPKDPNDEKNVIVEIKGAAGGDEANIFAGDLLGPVPPVSVCRRPCIVEFFPRRGQE